MSGLKKRGSTYYIKFSKTRKGKTAEVIRSLDTKNKEIAKSRKKQVDADYREGLINPFEPNFELNFIPFHLQKNYWTVQECIDDYLEAKKHLRQHTIDNHRYCLNHMARVCKIESKLSIRIDLHDIEPFLTRDVKPQTIRSDLRRLKTFWRWVIRKNRAEKDIFQDVESEIHIPQDDIAYEQKMISTEEFSAMIRSFLIHEKERRKNKHYRSYWEQPWFVPVMFVFYYTGLREGEVLFDNKVPHSGLRGSDIIRGSDGSIEFIYKSKAKINRERYIPIFEPLCSILDEYLHSRGNPEPDEPVFINQKGQPVTKRSGLRQYKRFLKEANIAPGKTIHGMRHRRATTWLEQGFTLSETANMLGHASTSQTDRTYSHLAAKNLRKKMKKLMNTSE